MAQQTIGLSPPVHPYEGGRPLKKADLVERPPRRSRSTRNRGDDAPKRPANGFIIFRSDYLKEHPELRSEQKRLSKRAGPAWKALPTEAKATYEQRARENSARYTIEKLEHKQRSGAIKASESDGSELELDSSSSQSPSTPDDREPSLSTSISSWHSDVYYQAVPQDASYGCAGPLNIPAAPSFNEQFGGSLPPTTLPTLPTFPATSDDLNWLPSDQDMYTQQNCYQQNYLPFPFDGPWEQQVVDENYMYSQYDMYAQEPQPLCLDGYSGLLLESDDFISQPSIPGLYTAEPAYPNLAYDVPDEWYPSQPSY
ncbi:hypothetical protein K525DRAFT_212378 [Schizophyllum commune Loenen D]|nr:hypothetical protein K525DRAFT_212378 [Schizophyllum commune Loenen D]